MLVCIACGFVFEIHGNNEHERDTLADWLEICYEDGPLVFVLYVGY